MKKNLFIFHSLNADTLESWGKILVAKFGDKIEIIMPNFPIRAESSYEKFEEIVLPYLKSGELSENSVVVCHSIGNPYFIRFSNKYGFVPRVYVSVAPGAVYPYPETRTDYIVEVKKRAILKQEEFDYVKKNFKRIELFYSLEKDNNLEKFTRFIDDTGANAHYLEGYDHFTAKDLSVPELEKLIDELF